MMLKWILTNQKMRGYVEVDLLQKPTQHETFHLNKCVVVYEKCIHIWHERIASLYSAVKNNDGHRLI